MSMAQSPASRGKSRERSQSQTNQVPFSPEFSKMLMKSSPRFGSLSHHSFFSRHNPHPNRVKHIQGEQAAEFLCLVVVEHIFKVVVLKSMILSIQFQDQPEEEFVLRKTQYSAETGRIIPSSTNSYQRRPYSQRLTYPQTFHDQELMVFELLCQILQTDSLSAVQQWLLLAESQICLRGLYNLYTYDIPVPGPHIESGKTPPKNLFHRETREETFRRATEEDPSPRMNRSNRCHVYRMNSVTELQHIQ
uniref:Thymus, brain and testes associated n=1 Tax=Cyclopterus lumpus TaxID=8103 RepID=A0A8C2ZFW0_CYCLU